MHATMVIFGVALMGVFGAAHLNFLFNGLHTGTMRSLPFGRAPAEASRRDRPTWFWTLTAANVFFVAISIGFVAALLLGQ